MDYNLIEVSDGKCWSVKEEHFVENAIDEKQIGHVTPRAFSPFNATTEPEPRYLCEILENSLTEDETVAFCEDFLRLVNHNQKGHKQKVPCLIGDANSGKTSLFQPLLGLIHHENIATITKQNESDPMPTQLKNDLTMLRQKEAEKEKESRELKAREAFDGAWLRRTEKELREETANKPGSHLQKIHASAA